MNGFDLFVSRLPLAPGVRRFHVDGNGFSQWRLRKNDSSDKAVLTLHYRNGDYSVSLRVVSANMPTNYKSWPLDDPTFVYFILAILALSGFIAFENPELIHFFVAQIVNAHL